MADNVGQPPLGPADFVSVNREAGYLDNIMGSVLNSTTQAAAMYALFGDRLSHANKEATKLHKTSKQISKEVGQKLVKYWKAEIPLSIIKSFKTMEKYSIELQQRLSVQSKEIRTAFVDSLKIARHYGMNIDDVSEGMQSAYDVLRNTNQAINAGYIDVATKISKAYGLSMSESSKYVSKITKYTGQSANQIKSFTEYVDKMSRGSLVSTAHIIADITDNIESMMIYGMQNMAKMTIFANRAGINIRSIIDLRGKMKDIEGALELSAAFAQEGGLFSKFGSVPSLLRAANTENGMDEFMKQFQQAIKSTTVGGKPTFQTERILQRMAAATNLSYEELLRMATMTEIDIKKREAQNQTLEKIALANTRMTEILGGFKSGVFEIFDKIASAVGNLFHIKAGIFDIGVKVGNILGLITTALLVYKAGSMARNFIGGRGFSGKGFGRRTIEDIVDEVINKSGGKGIAGGSTNIPGAGGGATIGKVFGGINWKGLAASAGSMIAVAGAMWIISKALNNFNTVDWSSLGKAGVALGGLIVGITGLGALMMIPGLNVAIAAGAGVFTLFSVGLLATAKAAQIFAPAFQMMTVPFVSFTDQLINIGKNTPAILAAVAGLEMSAVALAAFSMAGMGAGIGGLLGGNKQLDKILEFASKSNSLKNASESIRLIGENLSLVSVGIRDMDVAKLRATVDSLTSLVKPQIGRNVIPIENRITMNVDGYKLMEMTERTLATVG